MSSEQQNVLCARFTTEEVKCALWDIDERKAPGSDGYTNGFYKHDWPYIGEDIAAVLNFFQNGKLLKQINATTLCLIPKC